MQMKLKLPGILLLFVCIQAFAAPANPAEKYYRALALFNAQKIPDAEKLFLEFLEERPYEYEVRDAIFYLGEINRRSAKYDAAVTWYNKLEGRYPHSRYRTDLSYYYGECYFYMNMISRARESFLDYLGRAGDTSAAPERFVNSYYYLAKIQEIYREWEHATESYHKALLVLDPWMQKVRNDRKLSESLLQKKREIYYAMGLIYSDRFFNQELAHFYLSGAVSLGQPMTPSLSFLLRRLTIVHIGRENGLPDDAISDIAVDGDDVWISTWGGGLVRFARSSGVYNLIPLPTSQLRNLYVDFENIYISSFDGIFIFDKKSSRSLRLSKDEKLFSLAQKVVKDDRSMYFSTLSDGVIQYDIIKKNLTVLNESSYLQSRMVYSMDANHKFIAFGTVDRGAVILDKESGDVHYVGTENKKLGGDNVKSVLIDGRFVWLGVHKFGVYRYDTKTRECRFFDWGLPYPSSFALRGRMLWIGTSGNGVRIFDREKNTLEKLTVIEGLSSNEIHMIRMEGKYVWIGYLDNGIDILYKPDVEQE